MQELAVVWDTEGKLAALAGVLERLDGRVRDAGL